MRNKEDVNRDKRGRGKETSTSRICGKERGKGEAQGRGKMWKRARLKKNRGNDEKEDVKMGKRGRGKESNSKIRGRERQTRRRREAT